ncbi:unnamed protein product [Lomovskayavirus C31]|uniref:Gp2 n=1 Tax=Streptomyces phage phiC31 TaxID=10719 RepID=Q38023_BPPHC|nr:gp2 [Lomovskayavirus C31]CAA07126.1 gp2 [Lomovskayavirus C31]CAA53913.1 unnamed protein product [Lomovskayavirus C31]
MRRSEVVEFLAFVGVVFVAAVVGLALSAFVVMILIGMWHGHNAAVPALGFIDCLYAVGLTSLLALIVTPVTRD